MTHLYQKLNLKIQFPKDEGNIKFDEQYKCLDYFTCPSNDKHDEKLIIQNCAQN